MRERLKGSADSAERSISEEVEFRLEQSFVIQNLEGLVQRAVADGIGVREITKEMIAAGVGAFPFVEPSVLGSLSEETVVSGVFLAMDAARHRHP